MVSKAPRAAVLVDGVEYFYWLEQALLAARRSILIVGWDFDGRIALCHDRADQIGLGDLLRSLVEQHPDLEVRILVWSLGVVHGPGAVLPMLVGASWQEHPRIQVRLDSKHPIYGAQHQKIVCIDDAIAFTGGMDLTVERWDDGDHRAGHPARSTPDGRTYPPVHDIQIALEGEAALSIADVARQRWHLATDELLEARTAQRSIWPQGLVPHFRNVPVGIACTMPGWAGAPARRDAARLTLDAICRARRVLYIEAQYLTSADVEKQLARRLSEPDGPEIIIVLTRSSPGLLERMIMGANRDRLLRRLRRHDRYGRLRVCYPAVPGPDGECDIKVHSKLIIVDDELLKIGSSNLNNRSMGLDSECDVAIEACNAETRQAIGDVRNRLLAEHLATKPETVAKVAAREGSFIRALDGLNVMPRGLRPLTPMWRDGATSPLPLTWLLDPKKPFATAGRLRRVWRSLLERFFGRAWSRPPH